MEWLKVARSLGYWDEEEPAHGPVVLPSEPRKRQLNNLTAEIHLLGSSEVIRATEKYLDYVMSDEASSKFGGPYPSLDEFLDAFSDATAAVRRAVVDAMRSDLGTGPLP